MHLTSLLSSVSGLKFHIEELAAANLVNVIAQGYSGNEYDEEKEYSPQMRRGGRYRERTKPNALQDLMKNQKQLGAILLGAGLLLTVMGVMLFFEGNLLRLGNIGILAGTFLLIGPSRVSAFFLKKSRLQATIITSIGILLLFFGRPKLGLLIELFGLLNLFGNMFPMLLAVGKSIPGVGDVISAFEGPTAGARKGRYCGRGEAEADRRYNPQF